MIRNRSLDDEGLEDFNFFSFIKNKSKITAFFSFIKNKSKSKIIRLIP